MKKLLEFLNKERGQVIAAVICIFLVFYGVSCESQVSSLVDPADKVTRSELTMEVETFIAKAEAKYKDLDRQDEIKALLFDKFTLWTQTGTFNPIGILPTVFTILGVGAITDNVSKRKQIKDGLCAHADKTTTPGPSAG